jgi:hypothetical protein
MSLTSNIPNYNIMPVTQNSEFLSSNINLAVGLKLISIGEFDNWFNRERIPLGNEAKDAIYRSTDGAETLRVYASMRAAGVQFVDNRRADWTTAPTEWEVEKYVSDPAFGGKTMITVRKPKDQYAYHRQYLLLADLEKMFTSQTVQQLVDYNLETTKSTWAMKAGEVRSSDIAEAVAEMRTEVSNDIGPAVKLIAEVDAMTPLELAERMQDLPFRSRFVAAKSVVNAAKAFK